MGSPGRHGDPPADAVVARRSRGRLWPSYAAAALAVIVLLNGLVTGDFSWSFLALTAFFGALAAKTKRAFARVDADGIAWSEGFRTKALAWEDISAIQILSPPRALTRLTTPIFLIPTSGRKTPLVPGNGAGQAARFRAALIAHAQHRGVEVRQR